MATQTTRRHHRAFYWWSRTIVVAAGLFAALNSAGVRLASGQSAASSSASAQALSEAQRLVDAARFKEAALSLAAILRSAPNSRPAHELLGYTYLRLNDPRNSLAEYTLAAKLEQPSAADLQNVSKDYVLLNDLSNAEHWMSRAIQMDPADPEGWYGLGRIRFTQQRFKEAADCFVQALRLAPRSVKAENNLGLAYEGLNQSDAAEQAYRQALAWQQQDPHPSEQPLLNLGTLLAREGKTDEASALLQRAVQIAPQEPRSREQLGHVYLETGKLSQAEEQLRVAIDLEPQNSALHFLLGRVYHQLGQEAKAKSEFATASSLSGYRSTPDH